MRILYVVDNGRCSHDYASDNLYRGLVGIYGAPNVMDWPRKPTLHLTSPADRDDCELDCDQMVPDVFTNGEREAFPDWKPNICIVAGAPTLTLLKNANLALWDTDYGIPLAFVDGTDQVADLRRNYDDALPSGHPKGLYFKRELPLGADWGIPFPLHYPACKVPQDEVEREHRCIYWATDHNGGAPGVPRHYIVDRLRKEVRGSQLDVGLSKGQEKGSRPSPEALHDKMRRGMVGLSWNGAEPWDCNRVWENFAFGLAQVMERPRIQIPHPPIEGIDCLYADTPSELVDKVKTLLNDERRARTMGANGRAHYLEHHSSEARAKALIERLGRC